MNRTGFSAEHGFDAAPRPADTGDGMRYGRDIDDGHRAIFEVGNQTVLIQVDTFRKAELSTNS